MDFVRRPGLRMGHSLRSFVMLPYRAGGAEAGSLSV
jgi:hypothetical protein